MSVKVIIFDFDGTLADTLDAIVTITNRLAKNLAISQQLQKNSLKSEI
jgi:phosphoglycolate phosphatase